MREDRFTLKTFKRLADELNTVALYNALRQRYANCSMLECTDYHTSDQARSFIGVDPLLVYELRDGVFQVYDYEKAAVEKLGSVTCKGDLLDHLQSIVKQFGGLFSDEHPGLMGYMGFEVYDTLERLQDSHREASMIPDCLYVLYRFIIEVNHFHHTSTIYAIETEALVSEETISDLLFQKQTKRFPFSKVGEELPNMSDVDYLSMVKTGIRHCLRGDVFQVVLSRRFRQDYMGDDFEVYRQLRSINPSPYLFYFDFGHFRLMGSSPEAQLVVSERQAEIHPIAGTFKRSGSVEQNKLLGEALAKDPKESAEHLMLVDLARNDLSKSCDAVRVDQYKEVQYFSHVIHLVSKVCGQLRKDAHVLDIALDTFPAGTLSGAPKYRAIEIIKEQEPECRNFYGGAIGLLGFSESFNHAIIIRSILSIDNTLHYQAGAGVVAKSDPESELQEVTNKLGAVRKAIDAACKKQMFYV